MSETLISSLLEMSTIESETPFMFVRYKTQRVNAHGNTRTACVSENFLKEDESIITLSHLLKMHTGENVRKTLLRLTSDKKRIAFLAETTAEITGLEKSPEYLTLLFEIDALFLNDDRHLNNIAVIKTDRGYSYCPIFDNGAGLLSNMQMFPIDISPKALIKMAQARPFNTTFNRQMNTARSLYGRQLEAPAFGHQEITGLLLPLLEFYSERDRELITDRVVETILTRQKYF